MPELGLDRFSVADGVQRALSGQIDQFTDLILKQQSGRMDAAQIGCQQIVANPASILDHEFGQADDRCNRSPELLTREDNNNTNKTLARFPHGAKLSSCAGGGS